jgi:hypothetical protein
LLAGGAASGAELVHFAPLADLLEAIRAALAGQERVP